MIKTEAVPKKAKCTNNKHDKEKPCNAEHTIAMAMVNQRRLEESEGAAWMQNCMDARYIGYVKVYSHNILELVLMRFSSTVKSAFMSSFYSHWLELFKSMLKTKFIFHEIIIAPPSFELINCLHKITFFVQLQFTSYNNNMSVVQSNSFLRHLFCSQVEKNKQLYILDVRFCTCKYSAEKITIKYLFLLLLV